ncbi:MAG: peptidylprolyl isomerase [Betaproteobacteria bacterium RIFCSPLOWO2_12_FULL_62_58]|nr:MAG: peptidylprolyl isomerase [Betaproteobacteria bacterium RIFCSPLOWO2_12_FULL_62_58]
MQIAKNVVVALHYELFDVDGNLIEKTDTPIEYLHGGYDGIFLLVEQALDSKSVGDACRIRLAPDDAFGEYDAELVHVEPRSKFPGNLEVGMQFEGRTDDSDEVLVYTVTDIAEDKVVVDGNHPLAGQTLDFSCTVADVRTATAKEIQHGHVHDGHGHHH